MIKKICGIYAFTEVSDAVTKMSLTSVCQEEGGGTGQHVSERNIFTFHLDVNSLRIDLEKALNTESDSFKVLCI